MNPQRRKYYLIIVHYGSEKVTTSSLDAILSAEHPPDSIIVINNNRRPFKPGLGRCTVIETRQNLGYAGGINRGLGYLISQPISPRDIIICMNNDALVPSSIFVNLRSWWNNAPESAIASAMSREKGGVIQGHGYINLVSGRAKLTAAKNSSPTPNHSPLHGTWKHLPYLHGAFISAPYHVWLKIKGVPDQYFLYWEDALMSLRAANRQIPLYVLNDIIEHVEVKTQSIKDNQLYYLVRNGAHFLSTFTPLPWRQYWRIKNRARLLYHQLKKASPEIINGLKDGIASRLGPRSL